MEIFAHQEVSNGTGARPVLIFGFITLLALTALVLSVVFLFRSLMSTTKGGGLKKGAKK